MHSTPDSRAPEDSTGPDEDINSTGPDEDINSTGPDEDNTNSTGPGEDNTNPFHASDPQNADS